MPGIQGFYVLMQQLKFIVIWFVKNDAFPLVHVFWTNDIFWSNNLNP